MIGLNSDTTKCDMYWLLVSTPCSDNANAWLYQFNERWTWCTSRFYSVLVLNVACTQHSAYLTTSNVSCRLGKGFTVSSESQKQSWWRKPYAFSKLVSETDAVFRQHIRIMVVWRVLSDKKILKISETEQI